MNKEDWELLDQEIREERKTGLEKKKDKVKKIKKGIKEGLTTAFTYIGCGLTFLLLVSIIVGVIGLIIGGIASYHIGREDRYLREQARQGAAHGLNGTVIPIKELALSAGSNLF